MTNQATPRPWSINKTYPNQIEHPEMFGFRGQFKIAECRFSQSLVRSADIKEAEANAKLIVKAVNCHDELVEALKDISDLDNHMIGKYDGQIQWAVNRAKQALSKAQEEL